MAAPRTPRKLAPDVDDDVILERLDAGEIQQAVADDLGISRARVRARAARAKRRRDDANAARDEIIARQRREKAVATKARRSTAVAPSSAERERVTLQRSRSGFSFRGAGKGLGQIGFLRPDGTTASPGIDRPKRPLLIEAAVALGLSPEEQLAHDLKMQSIPGTPQHAAAQQAEPAPPEPPPVPAEPTSPYHVCFCGESFPSVYALERHEQMNHV